MPGRYHPVDSQWSDWSALACTFPHRCKILIWILPRKICSRGPTDHSIILARYTNVHRIYRHNTVHPRDLAKLSGYTKPYPYISWHHLTAIDIALPILEHSVPDSTDTAAQVEGLFLVQGDRRYHRIDRHRRLHDEFGRRFWRHLGPGIPSPRLAKILVDNVKHDGHHWELGNNGHERCRLHSISEEAKRRVLARILPSTYLPYPGTVWHYFNFLS